ncbi:MAG: ParA family protein [Phycisphaerales bacterium]|nr:ParA family protein [Phycisphaerales bacterium]
MSSPARSKTGAKAAVPPQSRTIALMNQKGGVGKTTTTVNLAAAIAQLGRRVLLVDLDPQAHATLHLGVEPAGGESETPRPSVYDVLLDPAFPAESALRKVRDNLWLLPAETDLAALETELAAVDPAQRTTRLRAALEKLASSPIEGGTGFEFVFFDCPPSLGVLTLNGLAAAREVFIPMQSHFLALQGVSKLLETVALVAKTVNPRLRVTGVVICMQDTSSRHSREVVQDLVDFFDQARAGGQDVPWKSARVLTPAIRRNIKLAECPSFGQTIFDYAPFCPGALDYRALGERVVAEWDELMNRKAEAPAPAMTAPAATHAPAPEPERAPAPVAPKPVVRGRAAKATEPAA